MELSGGTGYTHVNRRSGRGIQRPAALRVILTVLAPPQKIPHLPLLPPCLFQLCATKGFTCLGHTPEHLRENGSKMSLL